MPECQKANIYLPFPLGKSGFVRVEGNGSLFHISGSAPFERGNVSFGGTIFEVGQGDQDRFEIVVIHRSEGTVCGDARNIQ